MDEVIAEALASRDPERELLKLAQGCTEWTCLYHGAVNRALHKYRSTSE
jgi:hypothetical protein